MKPRASAIDTLIGGNVRTLRLAAALTQKQLAAALGTTYQALQKYERGVSRISAAQLAQIAYTLDIPIATLLAATPYAETAPRRADLGIDAETRQLLRLFARLTTPDKRRHAITLLRIIAKA